jgi:hypothetical protein
LQEAQPLQKSEAKLVKKTKSRKTQEDQPLQKAKLIFFQKRNKTLKILHRKVKPKYFKKKQNPKNRKGFSFHKKKKKETTQLTRGSTFANMQIKGSPTFVESGASFSQTQKYNYP